ncbi:MAG: DUF4097 domain-containing protein [Oscillospiraceae bacterium]|nr:DUF4097 domain-containing protein [Oscillospiraceae bacterium]
MNTPSKIWLIIAACLLGLGLLGFVWSLASHGWDFTAFDTTVYESETFEIDEAFENICIDAETEDVRFLPSEDGRCRVVFNEPKNVRGEAAVEDGRLSVSRRSEGNWKDSFSLFSFRTPSIEVYLPQADYGSLTVFVSTGKLEIPEDFRFAGVYLTASTGDIDCRASSSGPISVKTSTGDIKLSELSAGTLELSVSTGKVELRSVVCAGDVSLRVGTGKAQLKDITCKSLSSEGDTGDLTMENVIAAESITVRRDTGDVTLKRCDAAELTIKTDTGDVSGSLLTPKRFIARTDTGKIDVPETDGGVCRVTTDTGDIRFTVS